MHVVRTHSQFLLTYPTESEVLTHAVTAVNMYDSCHRYVTSVSKATDPNRSAW